MGIEGRNEDRGADVRGSWNRAPFFSLFLLISSRLVSASNGRMVLFVWFMMKERHKTKAHTVDETPLMHLCESFVLLGVVFLKLSHAG